MRLLIIILSSLLLTSSYSQLTSYSNDKDYYTDLKKDSTIVVLTGNVAYDSAVRKAVDLLWVYTPVTFKKLDPKILELKEGWNYLVLLKLENSNKQEHHLVAFLKGENKKLYEYELSEVAAYCTIDFQSVEKKWTDVYRRMPQVIYNIQNAIHLTVENKYTGNTLSIHKGLKATYNENTCLLQSKTLLLNQDRSNQFSKSEFEKIYPYKFEYCKQDKIIAALNDNDSNYAVFMPTVSINKYVWIYDAATKVPLYFDMELKGQKIDKKDIEELAKATKINSCTELKKGNLIFSKLLKPKSNITNKAKMDSLIKDSLTKININPLKKDSNFTATLTTNIKDSSTKITAKDSLKTKPLAIKDTVKIDTSKKAKAAAARLARIQLAKLQADSARIREAAVVRTIMDTTPYIVPKLKAPVVPKDKRLENKEVDFFLKQRQKFDEEAKIAQEKKEKEAKELAEKKKREFESRHLKPEDAVLFDKARYSEPPKDAPKKPADEYYNEIFK